jgi:hypothetical protein
VSILTIPRDRDESFARRNWEVSGPEVPGQLLGLCCNPTGYILVEVWWKEAISLGLKSFGPTSGLNQWVGTRCQPSAIPHKSLPEGSEKFGARSSRPTVRLSYPESLHGVSNRCHFWKVVRSYRPPKDPRCNHESSGFWYPQKKVPGLQNPHTNSKIHGGISHSNVTVLRVHNSFCVWFDSTYTFRNGALLIVRIL